MKRPMFFFACSECSGAPADTTICPPNPFFEDDRFLGLASANRVRLLGVVSGASSVAFLRGALVSTVPARGFVFDDALGTGAYVEPAPVIDLPALAATSGVFTFRYLHVGIAGSPSAWKQLQAPASGEWTIKVAGGNFTLVDAGQIPGINTVGDSGSTITKGLLLGLTGTTGNWTLSKFAIANNRPVVGDTSGTPGFKQLADASALVHPLAQFQGFKCGNFETVDDSGTLISGGLPLAVVGAVTDSALVSYSPIARRLYKAPARTFSFVSSATDTSPGATPPTAYAALPSSHLAGTSLPVNYPNVRIDVQLDFSNALANTALALFRDGTQIHEWPIFVGGIIHATYFDTGVTLANHTYSVQWKRGTVAVTTIIKYSALSIQTVP